MLSNEDILKEIGKGIPIHPVELKNIRGNSLNLSASNLAWSINGGEYNLDDASKYTFSSGTVKKFKDNEKNNDVISKPLKSIVHKNENNEEVIIIPSHDTALIETLEVISVNYKIGGTYHSKVGIVTQGMGHIGTTLDPGYTGQSLIAIHNHSNKPIILKVGDTFVTVVFNYLHSLSTYTNTNNHGHVELLTELGIKLSTKEKDALHDEWQKSRKTVSQKMLGSSGYKTFKKDLKTFNIDERTKKNVALIKALGLTVVGIIIFLFLAKKIDSSNLYGPDFSLFTWISQVGLSGIGVIIIVGSFKLLKNKFEEMQ